MHLFALFTAVLTLVNLVHGWGIVGHEVVATIAEVLLFPSTLQAIKDAHLLPPPSPINPRAGHLAALAGWPDRVRGTPYGWSTRLHYANAVGDWPPRNCSLGGGWKDDHNVLTAMAMRKSCDSTAVGGRRRVSKLFSSTERKALTFRFASIDGAYSDSSISTGRDDHVTSRIELERCDG